jgi:hypothetical protein
VLTWDKVWIQQLRKLICSIIFHRKILKCPNNNYWSLSAPDKKISQENLGQNFGFSRMYIQEKIAKVFDLLIKVLSLAKLFLFNLRPENVHFQLVQEFSSQQMSNLLYDQTGLASFSRIRKKNFSILLISICANVVRRLPFQSTKQCNAIWYTLNERFDTIWF